MKKKASSRQISANRKNSLKSTGPRSKEGKEKVRLNAIRHGLLSRQVVLERGENRVEYDEVLKALVDEYQPAGMIEEMLVDRITSCYWRLARVIRCETGGLRSQLDTARLREEKRQRLLFKQHLEVLNEDGDTEMLSRSSRGILFLIDGLLKAHAELEQQGFLSEETIESCILCIGDGKDSLRYVFSIYEDIVPSNTAKSDGKTESPSDPSAINEVKRILLVGIDTTIGQLKELLKPTLEREKLEIEQNIAILYLPPKELADNILRYETSIEKQFYRAVALLELMQRQRRE